MNDAEYRAFLNILAYLKPFTASLKEEGRVLTYLANEEARLRGYASMDDAYRNFPFAALEFNRWWHETGSGIIPFTADDMGSHARRVAEAAWKAAVEQTGK